MDELTSKAKLALKITTNDFDDEIADLVEACLLDLGIAGVDEVDTEDKLIVRAVVLSFVSLGVLRAITTN